MIAQYGPGDVLAFLAELDRYPPADLIRSTCSTRFGAEIDEDATANFAHPCGTTKGTVQTYATASCGHVTKTHQCGPYSADPASCASETSITGPSSCSSYSFAKITGPNVYLYIWDQNNVRGYCGGGGSSTTLPYPDQCPGVHVECHAN